MRINEVNQIILYFCQPKSIQETKAFYPPTYPIFYFNVTWKHETYSVLFTIATATSLFTNFISNSHNAYAMYVK
jgi:hypothetical protein